MKPLKYNFASTESIYSFSMTQPGVHIKVINTGIAKAIYSISNAINIRPEDNAPSIKAGIPITIPFQGNKVCAKGYFPSQ